MFVSRLFSTKEHRYEFYQTFIRTRYTFPAKLASSHKDLRKSRTLITTDFMPLPSWPFPLRNRSQRCPSVVLIVHSEMRWILMACLDLYRQSYTLESAPNNLRWKVWSRQRWRDIVQRRKDIIRCGRRVMLIHWYSTWEWHVWDQDCEFEYIVPSISSSMPTHAPVHQHHLCNDATDTRFAFMHSTVNQPEWIYQNIARVLHP